MDPISLTYQPAVRSALADRLRRLHRFACILAGCTLLLIAAGGMVTSTGSGLSVPDWPTTYGYNMFTFPLGKWVGGIFYEHGHRLIASTVGFLTIILAVWVQRADDRRWMRVLGWSALGVVIAQGALGGLTVIFLLPTWISVFHACLAQMFFCMIVSIAVFTGRTWIESRQAAPMRSDTRIRAVTMTLTAVVFIQLFLGALMRHTQSGLAVPDFPLAYGRALPGLTTDDVAQYNHQRAFTYFLPEVTRGQIVVHLLHRGWALMVTGMAIAVFVLVRRRPSAVALGRPALLVVALVAVQIGIGAWTVLSGRVPWIATLHVATGALLLGVSWMTALRTMGYRGSVDHNSERDVSVLSHLRGAAA